MSRAWSSVLDATPDPLTPDQRWAHDLIDRIVHVGRRFSRLTPAQQRAHDVDYIAKGLARKEALAVTRPTWHSEAQHGAIYGEAKVHYEDVAGEICDRLAEGDIAGAEALLVETITDELPARVAQLAANAEHGIGRVPRPKERDLALTEFEEPNPYAVDDARHEAWEDFQLR